MLVVHGTPGGWDQAAAMARFMTDMDPGPGVKAIMPSRPGYLGTPLAGREAIDAQADLHAALLDALGVERVGVLCWSVELPARRAPPRPRARARRPRRGQQGLSATARGPADAADVHDPSRQLAAAHDGRARADAADPGDARRRGVAVEDGGGAARVRGVRGRRQAPLRAGARRTHLAFYTHPDAASAQTRALELLLR
jgi:hypothetical protein